MGLNWFSNRAVGAPSEPPNASRLVPGPSAAGGADALTPSWQDMVRQLGEEVATSLNSATEQLTRLNRLEPGLVRSLGPVQDAVERARQAGMAAQHVLRLVGSDAQPVMLPLPQDDPRRRCPDISRAREALAKAWGTQRNISIYVKARGGVEGIPASMDEARAILGLRPAS